MADNPQQFDTRPQAVNKWLANLPIAHVGETARQLYMTIRDVNRQDTVPVKHYFHLMEGVCEPLIIILPELHRHYAGKPLPLSQKRRKVADLYTQLLRQAILGYQNVIAHSIELSRFGWKKVITTCVHRIFALSSLMLCNYRQLYMPYQKGMWQQLYWIYQLVEKYDLLNVKVAGLGEHNEKTAIGVEFKKLLLNALLSPNLFRPQELQEVLDNMDVWAQHVAISASNKTIQNQTYAFTLETDLPPGLMAETVSQSQNPLIDVRYFDISDLLGYLNHLLNNEVEQGVDQIKLSRQHSVSRRALLILLNSWGRPMSRNSERRLIQGHAEVAIGISAIHYVISDGRQETAETKTEPAQPEVTEDQFTIILPDQQSHESELMSFAAESEKSSDVWESVYFDPEPPPPSWTESMRMKVYSYLNAKVLNISKNGFCIALPQEGIEHIQTNQVVAIRGKNGNWQLGEIRWMICPTNGPIRAGIQKHSPTIIPAELHQVTEFKPPQPIKCLVGENEFGQLLFLPNLPTSFEHKQLLLEIKGKKQAFTLGEALFQTPIGSAHYFEWKSAASATQNKQQTDADTTGEYGSIWASL